MHLYNLAGIKFKLFSKNQHSGDIKEVTEKIWKLITWESKTIKNVKSNHLKT